jgi:predicted TIM-barrel fold metal-dependent hydrolase
MSHEDPKVDTWLSDDQLAKCVRADTDPFPSPIPTQIVSNGEWMPMPQTEEQQRIEARTNELAAKAAKKLGMSRRQFMATTGGMAATFLAMNEIFGRYFTVSRDALYEGEAFAADGPPRDLFIFDDQLHMIRQSNTTSNRGLRALAQGYPGAAEFTSNPFNPPLGSGLTTPLLDELALRGDIDVSDGLWRNWNPALVGDPMDDEIFHLEAFIKSLFLDSQMTVGLLSNITGFLPVFVTGAEPRNVFEARSIEVLTADQTAGVRDFVNKLAGSQRLYAHGLLYPGTANLFEIQRQIDQNQPDSWKGYCVSLAAKQVTDPAGESMKQWRLDDEQVMYPTFELIKKYQHILQHERPGFGNICVHKGFAPPPHDAAHDNPENGNPEDLPKVARDWPSFNFIIYHSCIRPVLFYNPTPLANLLSAHPVLREGVPDIEWTTRFAQLSRRLHNVYAEVGSTFASTIITFPSVWAHIIGQLLQNMGSKRVVFGSDSLWYGSPQWQYEAFWRFQIPERLQDKWDYPEIKDHDKRNIIGLNSARLYNVAPRRPKKFGGITEDWESKLPADLAVLKTLLEFPHASDNISKMRQRYLAEGATPDHRRYGWIRALV